MPTRRQEIVELLKMGEWGFHDLRRELRLSVKELEEDLRHVARSFRRGRPSFRTVPPRCRECGFEFKGRGAERMAPPSRCPRCRNERVEDPRFSVG